MEKLVEIFIEKYKADILKDKLYECFVLHLITLQEYTIIDKKQIVKLIKYFQLIDF